MEHQFLKLVVLQGPKKGETFEFPSKSTVKIGRVVRGNNLPIKDDGISSKHLVIGPESPSSCKWIVQDLDSSNGTSLNSLLLPPFTPFVLHDGDTLKLGAETSILVRFQESEEPSQLRRYPKRKVKESVIKATDEETKNNVRRGRPPKARVLDAKELENVEKLNVGVTRNRKNEDKTESEPIVVIKIEEEGRELERENAIMEKQQRRGRPRKARVLEDKESENVDPKGEELEGKKVNSRVTRKIKKKDCVVSGNLDGKMTRRGRGRRKNGQKLSLENLDLGLNSREDVKEQIIEADISRLDSREEVNKQVNEVNINGDEEEKKEGSDEEIECENVEFGIVEESVHLGLDSRDEEKELPNEVDICRDEEIKCDNGSIFEQSDGKVHVNECEKLGEETETVRMDLERMTLGQWFDYMEYSHKQTSQAIEEIIEGMRMKAVQVKKHIIEQKKAKAVAIG
ncbi:FHA domain-containing protein At4g14490 [Ricinus communis]|uniref:FHA domain-containing protein n=1 Tax=Ricinus communis TaxID=3988 RepID=B9SAL8_RICCO|nr:FHA domain-containing protein At4g14490 [Ricinus communis]XP_048231624.1 FHA domain-containing protein At4g14490 [Ricinus communis]EEF39341.1 conserved hypothetical protein [Ricinus communis]|eukprot:XP_002523037.1 FHA domain-containing protein At4g14490 [Ricinus communis]